MKHGFGAGQILIAVDGDRRVRVTRRKSGLWAVPILKEGMDPMPLTEWLDVLLCGARVYKKGERWG